MEIKKIDQEIHGMRSRDYNTHTHTQHLQKPRVAGGRCPVIRGWLAGWLAGRVTMVAVLSPLTMSLSRLLSAAGILITPHNDVIMRPKVWLATLQWAA